MSSESELDDELRQVAGLAKGSTKRKRGRQVASDSEEDVSLDDESEWDEEEYMET